MSPRPAWVHARITALQGNRLARGLSRVRRLNAPEVVHCVGGALTEFEEPTAATLARWRDGADLDPIERSIMDAAEVPDDR